MSDTFEFTLNNPLTDEEWDMLTDVDLDKTDRITFETKHGKHVEFAKVIRCKYCIKKDICADYMFSQQEEGYCAWAARKEE